MKAAILTDLTKCIGCEACSNACKEINGLPKGDSGRLDENTWTRVQKIGNVNVRRQCMHCEDPACVSVCPVGALEKTPEGPVTYDADKCIGCRYCMVGCPFNIPKYQWSTNVPVVRKCIMCFDERVSKGQEPACTSVCPTGATKFGDRDALIAEAYARIRENPDRYVDHVYGVEEAGGTSVLYLSAVPFEQLGFKTTLRKESYPQLTWNVLSKLPNVVSIAGVGLAGVWWIINRRDTLSRIRHEASTGGKSAPENTSNETHEDEGGAS